LAVDLTVDCQSSQGKENVIGFISLSGFPCDILACHLLHTSYAKTLDDDRSGMRCEPAAVDEKKILGKKRSNEARRSQCRRPKQRRGIENERSIEPGSEAGRQGLDSLAADRSRRHLHDRDRQHPVRLDAVRP
jgi:hypothetical protein